jgi:hypothetical protein
MNPYIAGSPVTGREMFFGREDVFSFVRRNLIGEHRDTPIVLYGQRRTGKTSVFYQLHRHLDSHYRCILIDLHSFSLDGEANLVWGIANSISRSLKRDHQISVGIPDRDQFFADPRAVFETVFLDAVWSALGKNHLVLMMDEVIRLDEEVRAGRLERKVFDYLRHLMQHFEGLNFIFSLGSGLEEMKIDYALLFSVALYHRISFLESEAARALITQPVRDRYEVTDDAVKKILQITSGHPYYTQLVCHCIVDRWLGSPKPTMTGADVDAVLAEAIELGSANLTYVWEDSTPEEQAMMAGMAAVMSSRRPVTADRVREAWRKVGVSLSEGDVARAVRSLINREVVAGEQAYSFVVDLQRMWLEKHRRLDWVKEELAEAISEWDRPADAGPAKETSSLPHEPEQRSLDGTADGRLQEPHEGSVTGTAARQSERRRLHLRRRLLILAAVGVLAVAITAVVLIVVPGPGPVTAASAVAAVQPNRLIDSLLSVHFAAPDLPDGSSASAPLLSDAVTSLASLSDITPKASGLAAAVQANFSGADGMGVRYYVFDNVADAHSYFASTNPYLKGYTFAGSFQAGGIGDSTQCRQSTEPTHLTSWVCQTLSGYVESLSWVIESGTGDGLGPESKLALDAVRHLGSVAKETPPGSLQKPPGSLKAGALIAALGSAFPAALVPQGLSAPEVSINSASVPGLAAANRIEINFLGAGADYTSSWINFWIFDNVSDAKSWFGIGLKPEDAAGKLDTPTNHVPFQLSGFSPDQQEQCNTYSQPALQGNPARGVSACFAQWGDVVVEGATGEDAAPGNTKTGAADSNMALTLARAALLRVGQIIVEPADTILEDLIPSAIDSGNQCQYTNSPGFGATAEVDCSNVPDIPASNLSYYLFADSGTLNNAYGDFLREFAHVRENAGKCAVQNAFSPPCEAWWSDDGSQPALGRFAEYDYKGTPDITTTFNQNLVIVDMKGPDGDALLNWWDTLPDPFLSTGS